MRCRMKTQEVERCVVVVEDDEEERQGMVFSMVRVTMMIKEGKGWGGRWSVSSWMDMDGVENTCG